MNLSKSDLAKVHQLFSYLDITPELIEVELDGDTVKISLAVPEEESGIFIGRYATTLDSLQLILALFLRSDTIHHIHLDIAGYRERRSVTLQEIASRVEHDVLQTGLPRALPPLTSSERRQVHLMYKDHHELATYSEGEGRERRLFLAPKTH